MLLHCSKQMSLRNAKKPYKNIENDLFAFGEKINK